jgi:hypothetical protein
MTEDEEIRLINHAQFAMESSVKDGPNSWFVAFGALLYFIRDKRMNKPFATDLDICVPGEMVDASAMVKAFEQCKFKVEKHITIDDGKTLQVTFRKMHVPTDVDVFILHKRNGMYWHSGALNLEQTKDGTLPQYTFKGIPCELIGETVKYKWNSRIEKVQFPAKYGSLLDTWYPGWYIPDSKFGQSRAPVVKVVKSMKEL